MSYVITAHTTVENVIHFSLYEILVGRYCSTPSNYCYDPPLLLTEGRANNSKANTAHSFSVPWSTNLS